VPGYRLVITKSAKKDIDKLNAVTRRQIAKRLRYFLDQNDPLVYARRLVHTKIGRYRFRVGHYRIVFDVSDKNIEVLGVKHRKDIYRA
jgi:mRNA interferase RelE/StbE